MDNAELCYTSATDLTKMIKSREISPREITMGVLERIEAVNPKINAFCTVASEQALKAAENAEVAVMKGEKPGPLLGVPISMKDLTQTKGIRTTYGSRLYENNIPDEDDVLVQRLKAAGAIIIGKTNTPELGAGMNTTNTLFGTTLNPWDMNKTSGGSSGGAAAALAAGLGPLAEGSDLGGSLRIPASFCGVVGFRVTPGLIPRYPASWAWDEFSVNGPMARTVGDTALMLSAMAGPHDLAPLSIPDSGYSFLDAIMQGCEGLRAAWTPNLGGLCQVDPEVERICAAAARNLQNLGVSVEDDSPNFHDAIEIIIQHRVLRTAVLYEELLRDREKIQKIDNPVFTKFMDMIDETKILDFAAAERKRTKLLTRVYEFFQNYDILLSPTVSIPAFSANQSYPSDIGGNTPESLLEYVLLTYAWSITKLPAISVPAGWTENGLPVGIQIIGRRLADRTVLMVAANFERIAPWAHCRPPV